MKNIQFCLIVILICGAFASCHKDLGNYNYNEINEISFLNFNTENGYTIRGGETLNIMPQLSGTLDEDASKRAYSYEWSLDLGNYDSVLSTEKNLSIKVTMPPGRYTLQYKVTDEETRVTFQTRAELLVTTKVYEGYMVMSEVNGNTRLDMLSYDPSTGQFTMITDVLAEMGSTLQLPGKPVQVFCFETESFFTTPESYRIYLLTETGTYKVHPETFAYGPLDEFKYEVVGDLPNNFNPNFLTGYLYFGLLPTTVMVEQNNVYKRTYQGAVFPLVPINIYPGESKPFKAFPQVTCNDDAVVMFNMDKKCFTYTNTEGVTATDLTEDLGFPQGKDLVYMEDHQATWLGYAIMKDPGTTDYHLLRFYPGFSFADMFVPIMNATDFDKATHFAVHPQYGYVFYSVGGKVYEYDPFLQSSFLMLDKGSAEITHLSFQEFFNPNYDPRYSEMGNILSVGSLDPTGTEGENGTFELFRVRDVNRPLELQHSWTGFGKIASISYRERT